MRESPVRHAVSTAAIAVTLSNNEQGLAAEIVLNRVIEFLPQLMEQNQQDNLKKIVSALLPDVAPSEAAMAQARMLLDAKSAILKSAISFLRVKFRSWPGTVKPIQACSRTSGNGIGRSSRSSTREMTSSLCMRSIRTTFIAKLREYSGLRSVRSLRRRIDSEGSGGPSKQSRKERQFRALFRIVEVAQADTHEAKLLLGVRRYLLPERQSDPRKLLA